MRLFVAIWIPEEVLMALPIDLMKEAISRQGVRFTSPEKIHLTLRFLGNVQEEFLDELVSSLSESLAGIEVGDLEVKTIGGFPGLHRPKTIWLGVEGDLTAVHERVVEATDVFAERPEENEFNPHLTLARVSPPSQKVGRALEPLVQKIGNAPIARWQPTEIVLVQTMPTGGYETRATFPITTAEA